MWGIRLSLLRAAFSRDVEGRGVGKRVAGGAEVADAVDLELFDFGVGFEDFWGGGFGFLEAVYADYYGFAGFYLFLIFIGGVLDFALDEAFFYGSERASHFVDAGYVGFGFAFDFVR